MMKIVLSEPSIEPDWQPQASASLYSEGHLRFSSVGQLWEVKDRCWQRVREPTQEQLIGLLAERFLGWPLPESVCSDLCATKQQKGRVGTNLLTATEARQMVTYLFGGQRNGTMDDTELQGHKDVLAGRANAIFAEILALIAGAATLEQVEVRSEQLARAANQFTTV